MKVLFVEPDFPRVSKSKNHAKFMPIGLIKLANYHRKLGNSICILRGEVPKFEIYFEAPNGRVKRNSLPDQIYITSYFTYWSKYVKKSVKYYKSIYPNVKVVVGGIYASLMPEHCKKYTGCDEVFVGVHEQAEQTPISYRYLEKNYGSLDYQIIHTSRGCVRQCKFCGVYRIEPEFTYKTSILKEIKKKKIIFYDNNLLANPAIENILSELAILKYRQKISWCESQSGIDGRLLLKNPEYAQLLKNAGFREIRISWDGPLSDAPTIAKQIRLLKKVGFQLHRNVFVFMIYNWEISFEEMEQKRLKCWEWKVQISDCRYRPLNQTHDRYNGQMFRRGQNGRDYHIHRTTGWTDKKIRLFRKHIRRQNICVRTRISFYSNDIERSFLDKYVRDALIEIANDYPREEAEPILNKLKIPYWFPENYDGNGHYRSQKEIFKEFERSTNKPALRNGNIRTSQYKIWRNSIQREVIGRLK